MGVYCGYAGEIVPCYDGAKRYVLTALANKHPISASNYSKGTYVASIVK